MNTKYRIATAGLDWVLRMAVLILLLCVVCVAGCASGWLIEIMPGQIEAVAIVSQVYGIDPAHTPPIRWITGEDLNCVNSSGPGWLEDGYCTNGSYQPPRPIISDMEHITLPLWKGQRWVETTMPHEMCHFMLYSTTGDGDGDHQGPCFNDPGEHGEQNHGKTRTATEALLGMSVGPGDNL